MTLPVNKHRSNTAAYNIEQARVHYERHGGMFGLGGLASDGSILDHIIVGIQR
jgi:hypothetical protein